MAEEDDEDDHFPGEAAWSLDDIPYGELARDRVRDNALLLYVVASASFIEITSDVYTRNLADFYRGDAELTGWLERAWEREEIQHGQALKRYVETAWPDFDWERAYRNFLGDYLRLCSVDQLAPTRALEMAARCVVETGTATFYRALGETSPEPVLRRLALAISADEVRHYKHFYRSFRRYREREGTGRLAVARTLWARIGEVDAEDAFYAFKHAYLAHNPGSEFRPDAYAEFRALLRPLAAAHYPHRMASKMLLKPLDLSPRLGRIAVPALASASRLLFF